MEVEQQEKIEEKIEEKTEEKVETDKDADYWRQQAQQNDANARRERQTREDNEKAALETKAQLTQTTEKLQEIETKIEQQSEYHEMDKEAVDPAVAKNIETLRKQIEGLSDKLGEQQVKITKYEQNEVHREQERQYNDVVESICKPLDEKYGSKYRSQVRSLADKAVDDGSEKKPETMLEAYFLHEKFYIQLSEKKDVKKTTTTDNGKKTVLVKGRKEAGKYDDVFKEMQNRCKS